MGRAICVYCSSSNSVDAWVLAAAHELGTELGRRGHSLVYGGATVGSMGTVAAATQEAGGTVVGVIPASMQDREIAWTGADELIITESMRERKAIMEDRADAFIALPGGFGTLEELLEVLTLRFLGYHDKPVVLANLNGFYDTMLAFFDELYAARMARESHKVAFSVATSIAEAVALAERTTPVALDSKWL